MFQISDGLYDVLKKVAQFVLPGLATLYFAIGGIWGLPYTEQVVGTIVALDVFLGAILGLSNATYRGEPTHEDEKFVKFSSLAMPSTNYEWMKWIALLLLPALGTLYFTLGQLWNFPYGEQVVGTIAAISAFMGLMLGVSTRQYNKFYNG